MRFADYALAALICLLLGACSASQNAKTADSSAADADAVIPDHAAALQSHPRDYIGFLKAWFAATSPELDSPDIVRYAFPIKDKSAELATQKLIAGNEAFCKQRGGSIVPSDADLTCAAADGKSLARLSVQVYHASDEQSASLQFTGESAAWMTKLKDERMADYRRVIATLSGNGITGTVLVSSGESFDVVRFGRLSQPDFYALKTPNHGLVNFSDIVSAKWGEGALSVVERDGDRYDETGEGLTPHATIVRLRPTPAGELKAEPLTGEEPFRFVYVDPKSKQPRQVRVRGDSQILQINTSNKAARYRGGQIETRFDKKQREAFRAQLTAEARKSAANYGKANDHIDVTDAKVQTDLDQIGRTGPCARTQSDDRLQTGDIAFSEYLVCIEYRQEAEVVKANGGQITPEKTPLLLLGRAARAPWYDFNGVLR